MSTASSGPYNILGTLRKAKHAARGSNSRSHSGSSESRGPRQSSTIFSFRSRLSNRSSTQQPIVRSDSPQPFHRLHTATSAGTTGSSNNSAQHHHQQPVGHIDTQAMEMKPVQSAEDEARAGERASSPNLNDGIAEPATVAVATASNSAIAPLNPVKPRSSGSLDDSSVRRRVTDPVGQSSNDAPQNAMASRDLELGAREENEGHDDPEKKEKPRLTLKSQLKVIFFSSWINVLLVAAPVGIALNYANVDPVAVFVVNFLAIIPLAAMLSNATEEIAAYTNETFGGLLNATFGNAVELIVSLIALFKDEIVIVQTSLIGSILSNLLLVMGMCFFLGGVNRIDQQFNVTVAQTSSSLLALAVASLMIPTAFGSWSGAGQTGVAQISRGTSIMLLIVYGCYLLFQLYTHNSVFMDESPKSEKIGWRGRLDPKGDDDDVEPSYAMAQMGAAVAAGAVGRGRDSLIIDAETKKRMERENEAGEQQDEEEEGQPQLTILMAIITLAGSTALVALCAEYLVGSINDLVARGGISKTFVGLILLPIVGNAAEHVTAVAVAIKDKMNLAIGVAVGSSIQIALLVLPLIVTIGWIANKDDMTLYFDGFQVVILFVAVLLVNYLIQDGKSHWLEGVLLMTLYLIISVAAWFYPEKGNAVSESS